jgi:hypothetical protein
VRRADLITFIYRLSKNLEASISWNPKGLSRPVLGLLYLFKGFCTNGAELSGYSTTVLGSIQIIRHDTTRNNKILLYGFHMLKFTFVCHRQLTTKTLSLGLREGNLLPAC